MVGSLPGLLRARRERPYCGRAAEKGDELAPDHVALWSRIFTRQDRCFRRCHCPPMSTRSLKQPRSGVILEQLGVANIAAQNVNRAVTAHVHHLEDRRTPAGGRCQEALGNVRRCRSVLICSDSALNQGQAFCIIGKGPLRQAPVAERPVALPPENQGAKSCHCYSNHRRRRALSAAPRLSQPPHSRRANGFSRFDAQRAGVPVRTRSIIAPSRVVSPITGPPQWPVDGRSLVSLLLEFAGMSEAELLSA